MELTHGVRCIKGETHSLITLMRLNTRWATRSIAAASYSKKTSFVSYYDDEDPLIASFRHLNEYLEGVYDLHEVDCVRYVTPFHHIITSEQASGPLTSAALGSLSKFALYGFFSCHFPRIKEAMLLVADSISRCVFEETDWESDELILMKLLELSALCYRCNAANLLSVDAAWDIFCTCISIHNHYRASKILKSEAETALIHLTLNIFTRASDMVRNNHQNNYKSADECDNNGSKSNGEFWNVQKQVFDQPIDTLKGSRSPLQFTLSQPSGIVMLMLKIIKVLSDMLINVALEAGGTALSSIAPLVDVLRNDICRHLLKATQSEDLGIFSLSLRVVFNLFMSIKDHMKVQLEVFLSSVHLRLLDQSSNLSSSSALVAASAARDELILESLLEFCREPALMQDLYTNYDCDVQCTNLFDAIINTLCRRSTQEIPRLEKERPNSHVKNSSTLIAPSSSFGSEKVNQAAVRMTILHKLAFDGLLAVLHSMAGKIQTPLIDDRSRTDTPDAVKLEEQQKHEFLIEKEIDKWCEIQVDNENLTQEDFEVYSLVTHNAPYSPVHLNKRSNSEANQHFFPADTSSHSSSIPSSPLGFKRRHSESSCSSINSNNIMNVVDRENECTSSAESRAKSAEALRQRKLMKQKIKAVSEKFNDKPLKQDWLKAAVECGLLMTIDSERSVEGDIYQKVEAKSVAQFLKSIPGLGRPQIGEYISKGPPDLYPFHANVLSEYVKTFDFSVVNGSFDKALRLFLSFFRLPGEAQCIDRIMEAFAGRFFEQLEPGNPFANADAVFILSFSTIMLNTDLHNPHIAANKKMTKEEFVRNNRGINDRQDLPREYLEKIYDGIKANQIQVDIDALDSKSNIDFTDTETWNKLMSRVAQDQVPAQFTPTTMARKIQRGVFHTHHDTDNMMSYEVDMFLVLAKPAFETILLLWQHASDDLLLRRIVVGVFDYLQACSNLQLQNAISSAIRVFLWSIGKYFSIARKSSHNKLYSRSFIMSNRHSYQQWSKESGHDLKHLLHVDVETMIDSGAGIHGMDFMDSLDWSEASLIKSEILLRVVVRAATETSLNIHKHTWSTLFELLLWVRSRGSLPHDLAKLSNSFSYHSVKRNDNDESWKASSMNCNKYRPSLFARNCFMKAFGVNINSPTSTNDSHRLEAPSELSSKTNSGSSWISFLWAGGADDLESSPSVRKQAPLSAVLMESALANDAMEVFSNANASVYFDNKGHHLRTDDHFLQLTIDKCGLDQLFYTLLYENSNRGEALYAGSLLTLSRVLGKLIGRMFDSVLWHDSFENHEFEGNIPLGDIFPVYLLNDKDLEFHLNPSELDAVICLEWIGNFTFLNDKTWNKYGVKLKDILQGFLTDEVDTISKKIPYFFERCVDLLLRCILHSINDRTFADQRNHNGTSLPMIPKSTTNATFWGMLRLLSDLHVDLLSNLSGVIGSGLITLIKMMHYEETELSVDDWYVLLGILSNIWNGWEGRCRVWECISYLINEELICELNYTPCRNLIIKYLDKNAFSTSNYKNLAEKEKKQFRANIQEWTSNGMLYLLRLTLMALGGYITGQHDRTRSAEEGPRSKLCPPSALFKRLRSQHPRETFTFPDAHELKSQLFSPTKMLNSSISTSHQHDMQSSKSSLHRVGQNTTSDPHYFHSMDVDITGKVSHSENNSSMPEKSSRSINPNKDQQSTWLDVPCMQFTRMDECESIWVNTIGILSDLCNVPSLSLIHRAIYCLEVLISSGNVAMLPMPVWYKALDELIAKLPLNLVVVTNKLQPGLAPTEIHETCFRCCNLIFHLLVLHIRELRKAEHFTAMFIRYISAMAANAGVSAKGYTTHTEMVSMIVALLRLLRFPERQPLPMELKVQELKVSEEQIDPSGTQEIIPPSGLLGVLHWMISPAPQQPPKPKVISGEREVDTGKSQVSSNSLSVKAAFDQNEGPVRLITLDHDGTMFLLTWKAITAVYSQLALTINSWDAQFYKSLIQSMELIEAIKVRGETDVPFETGPVDYPGKSPVIHEQALTKTPGTSTAIIHTQIHTEVPDKVQPMMLHPQHPPTQDLEKTFNTEVYPDQPITPTKPKHEVTESQVKKLSALAVPSPVPAQDQVQRISKPDSKPGKVVIKASNATNPLSPIQIV